MRQLKRIKYNYFYFTFLLHICNFWKMFWDHLDTRDIKDEEKKKKFKKAA
jgi:hypothetical protein